MMRLGTNRLRKAIAVAGTTTALVVGSALVTTTADAAPRTTTTTTARLFQCLSTEMKPVGKGWAVEVPSVWEDVSTICNLKYGDLPQRHANEDLGVPALAIKALQRNLNYCYGSRLVVDGKFGSKTRAAVQKVQRRHKITADGIYGPQTRSAMNWRMYHSAKKVWSKGCYDKL